MIDRLTFYHLIRNLTILPITGILNTILDIISFGKFEFAFDDIEAGRIDPSEILERQGSA